MGRFEESKIKRGQPGNAGQFAPKPHALVSDAQQARLVEAANATTTPEPQDDTMTDRPLPEIHLSSNAYTFGHWLPRDARDGFDLNAPYQRASVWTEDQRRALVKSMYMGLPVGNIIVSRLPYNESLGVDQPSFRIVDGKQRVEAIRAWANDEFQVPRSWFRREDITDGSSESVGWSDLTDTGRRSFEMGTTVPSLEFDASREWLGRDPATGVGRWRAKTDAEILAAEAELYGLVNGGGTAQTDEDMANAARVASEARQQ